MCLFSFQAHLPQLAMESTSTHFLPWIQVNLQNIFWINKLEWLQLGHLYSAASVKRHMPCKWCMYRGFPLIQDVFHLSLPDFINSSEQLILKKSPGRQSYIPMNKWYILLAQMLLAKKCLPTSNNRSVEGKQWAGQCSKK